MTTRGSTAAAAGAAALALLLLADVAPASAPASAGVEARRVYEAPEARQAVATDSAYFYAVGNSRIGKYDRTTGERVGGWEEVEGGPVQHLNSGVVVDGRLYCANSNYPEIPMVGSVEIFDTATMQHVDSFSFGLVGGSLTWIDYHDGQWYAGLGMYTDHKAEPGKDPAWTQVISLDERWRRVEGWVFPPGIVERFRPMTNSGASFGPDGLLYCTGHDFYEVYALRLPDRGSVLEHVKTVPVASFGQGIAWDRSGHPADLWGIIKKERRVVVTPMP